MTNHHRQHITVMQKFGFKANNEGMCFGIGHMGMQAIFAHDEKTFNQRFDLMEEKSSSELLEQFNQTKQKPLEQVSSEDQIVAGLPEYFKGVMDYQLPRLQSDSSHTKRDNIENTENVYPHTLPACLMTRTFDEENREIVIPMIEKMDVFSGMYAEGELEILFSLLRHAIAIAGCQEPVCFSLNSSKHSIMVGFNPKEQIWQLINAGPIEDMADDLLVAEAVKCALSIVMGMMETSSQPQAIPIFTMVYAHISDSCMLKAALNHEKKGKAWEMIHKVTAEKAQLWGPFRDTWMHVAAMYGQVETVRALLETKTNCDIALKTDSNYPESTPLYVAVDHGYMPIVDLLIEAKADLNHGYGYKGITPLQHSVIQGNEDMFVFLLQKGALMTSPEDLLYYAAQKGRLGILEMLLERDAGSAVNKRQFNQYKPLHIAIEEEFLPIVNTLLKARANPNSVVKGFFGGGITPLIMAIKKDNKDIVLALLNHGALINMPGKGKENQLTPLAAAIRFASPGMVELLLSQHADINASFELTQDWFLKFNCSEEEKTALAKFFLRTGKNSAHFTALHLAIFLREKTIVSILLSHQPSLTNPSSSIGVMEFAEAIGDEGILSQLRDAFQSGLPVAKIS